MTKRLFAYFGLTMLGVYTVVYYFGLFGLCAAGAVAAILLLYALVVKSPAVEKSVIIFVAVTIVLSAFVFTVYDNTFKSVSDKYSEQTVSVTAKVKSDGVKRYGLYNYELQAEKIDSDKVDYKILLYSNFMLSCEYGDTIQVNAELNSCSENYYKSRRFVYTAESDAYKLDYKVVKRGEKDIWYIPKYLQKKLSEAVKTVVKGENGELCSTMTFGDREQLSGDINAMFSKTGLSFLIVISGLHMSIISVFLIWVLKPFGKRRGGNILRGVIICLFIFIYMLITGWTASVIRSGFVVILSSLAIIFRRRSDFYNSIGFAALIIVFANPYAVGDVGMLLSFSSVLGIVYFYPRLSRRFMSSNDERQKEYYNEIKRTNQRKRRLYFRIQSFLQAITTTVINAFFVSISAVAASMPVVCLAVGFINPFTALTSFFLIPLTALIVVFTLITAFLFYAPMLGVLSYIFGAAAEFFSAVMIWIVRFIYSIHYLTLYIDRTIVWMWLLALALLLGIAVIMKRSKKNVLTAWMLSVVFLAASCIAQYAVHSNTVTLKVIGTSFANVRITGGGVEALLSYGGDYDKFNELIRKLRSSYGDVNTLIVPDNTLKTSRYAVNIMDEFDVDRVMLYHSKGTPLDLEEQAMGVKNYEEFYSADVVTLDLGQGITDTLINDGKSTWQYIRSSAATVLIVPDKADAEKLDEKYRTADVTVCGSEIKNINLLDYKNSFWVTKHDLSEDYNIRLK